VLYFRLGNEAGAAREVNVIEVNFDRRGSGSPLVLLHGIGHRWQAWRPVLDILAERHEVFAVDMPGFGQSRDLPTGHPHDLAGSMDMLVEIFSGLGLDRPHLAGNSLGGLIAVEAAAQGLVSSTTALSPAGFWNDRDRARALATLRIMRAGAMAPGLLRGAMVDNARLRSATLAVLHAHPERVDRITAAADTDALRGSAAFIPTLRAGRRFAWTGTPPTVPVTIAWGDQDRILPPRQAQRAARLLPNAHHLTLTGCGHVPMIDDPEQVARVILDTCDRAEREAPRPAAERVDATRPVAPEESPAAAG
jgi:pimeloyl-ACP methyl ester carboxylesterase